MRDEDRGKNRWDGVFYLLKSSMQSVGGLFFGATTCVASIYPKQEKEVWGPRLS